MPAIDELRNSAADGFYSTAGASSAEQYLESTDPVERVVEREIRVQAEHHFERLSAQEAPQPEMQTDYDEEDPTLPGSPLPVQDQAGESPAQQSQTLLLISMALPSETSYLLCLRVFLTSPWSVYHLSLCFRRHSPA